MHLPLFFACLFLAPISILLGTTSSSPKKDVASKQSVNIRGIALVHALSDVDAIDWTHRQGLYVDDHLHLPGPPELLLKQLHPLITNQIVTKENLLAIKQSILSYFNTHEQYFIAVEIPEQDISSGIIAFVVMRPDVGKVSYTGNRWFSKERVKKALDLHSNVPLDENTLLNNVEWLNENPFHYTKAVISPGKAKGVSDIEIVTKDRFPFRVYVGGDNTGTESTGRSRYYAGMTWGNAFWLNDLLTYQFTTNRHYEKYHSHVINYTCFTPAQNILMLYGGYARIQPDIAEFKSEGKEAQGSLRYKIPFKPLYTPFQHQLYWGFDYKYVTSNLFFVDELEDLPMMQGRVNISQAVLGYTFEYTPKSHDITLKIEFLGSPAKWLPHQTNHAFSTLRSHAMPRYFYGTFALGDVYTFSSQYAVSGLFRAQSSTNCLIASEQFALGGYNTVRGYEENVFVSDNGVCADFEMRSRPYSFFKKGRDALTMLAFMDYGWGYNYRAFNGIKKSATLWSVGPGLRYTINPYSSLRVDYGFKLHHVNFDDNTLGMWHVGANLSY